MGLVEAVQRRIAGALLVVAAAYFLWVGLRAVIDAEELTDAFVLLASGFGQPIERSEFLFHWRVTYTLFAVWSVVTVVAGVAMVPLKRWSCILLVALSVGAFAISVVGLLTGYTRYGFEGASPTDFLILVIVAAIAYLGYRKWPQQERYEIDA
jgi:hypothetical protein